jgi:hypothetical protein
MSRSDTFCVISFENIETKEVQTVTGKNAIVTEMRIEPGFCNFKDIDIYSAKSGDKLLTLPKPQELATISFTLKLSNEDLITELFFGGDFKPKIRNKKVEDCNIQELLFAVRNKIK